MNDPTDSQAIEQQATEDEAVTAPPEPPEEPTFQITVKKLVTPARPRGVLAE